jgi:protein-tyrosine-phosphatase
MGKFLSDHHRINRRATIIGVAALLTTGCVSTKSASAPRVLFVCQYGSVKSAIARELFRRQASKRGISVNAASRGITPEAHVSPALRALLNADAIDTERDGLNKLNGTDVKAADIVIVFDKLPAEIAPNRVIDWSAVPSMNNSYPEARADLDRRIDALLDMLVKEKE